MIPAQWPMRGPPDWKQAVGAPATYGPGLVTNRPFDE